MSSIRSLEVAKDLAQRRRDAMVQHLAAMEQAMEQARGQLKQLEDYVRETDGRMVQSGRAYQSMEVVRHQHHFMARLQHAIGLQTDVVANSEQQRKVAQELLVEAEGKLTVLQKLIDMRKAEVAREAVRREQRASDEFAQNMHLRKRNEALQGEGLW